VACEAKRRSRKAASGGFFNVHEVRQLYARQRGKCAVCKEPRALNDMHRDHIVPLVLGGDSWIQNIQLLCPTCNLSKSGKHPIQFMQSKGLLL
jgi:5-methylcytosine-specific restriction endonuclease McrA